MTAPTFFWHDYETSGADARRDRPTQFAGIRTDEDLQPVGEPVVAFCRMPDDVLPHPDAVLLTGITPQQCEREGMVEADFAGVVQAELGAAGTCGAGYNSIRFDDEFTRNLLYRNFHDPYAREWERGNCRYDLIDVLRLCYALRPRGIEWPEHETGVPSFKLEHLAAANALQHARAHDALSDVEATLGLARLVKRQQPRLFDWTLRLRSKRNTAPLLDWLARTPVLHASSRYPASRGCLAMVLPIAPLPDQPNAVVVFDLATDPTEMLTLDLEALRDRVFVSRADLPDGVLRVPLKMVRANKCPALAPVSALKDVETARIALDVAANERHLAVLRGLDEAAWSALVVKLQTLFSGDRTERETPDPELALYGGRFASEADRVRFKDVRRAPPAELASAPPKFDDARYDELLFRYRARNWPDTLDVDEHARWQRFRSRRLLREDGLASITLPQFRARIEALRATIAAANDGGVPVGADDARIVAMIRRADGAGPLLDQLEAWGDRIAADLVDRPAPACATDDAP